MKEIKQRHLEMVHPQGFDRLFEIEIRTAATYEEAFETLNNEFIAIFNVPRYRNYESYRQSRRQRVKM